MHSIHQISSVIKFALIKKGIRDTVAKHKYLKEVFFYMTTDTDMEWLYKARSKYWEEGNYGKKYAILRQIKNRFGQYSGTYTLEAIAERTGINVTTIRNFEAGVLPPGPLEENDLFKIITDMGLDMRHLKCTEKIRANTVFSDSEIPNRLEASPEVAVVTPAPTQKISPTYDEGVVKRTNKPKPFDPSKALTIVNHTLEPFIVAVIDGEIHVMEDTAKNLKAKGVTWVAPADEQGRGAALRPRSTKIL